MIVMKMAGRARAVWKVEEVRSLDSFAAERALQHDAARKLTSPQW